MMLDFKSVLVSDCCAALSDEEHRASLCSFSSSSSATS